MSDAATNAGSEASGTTAASTDARDGGVRGFSHAALSAGPFSVDARHTRR